MISLAKRQIPTCRYVSSNGQNGKIRGYVPEARLENKQKKWLSIEHHHVRRRQRDAKPCCRDLPHEHTAFRVILEPCDFCCPVLYPAPHYGIGDDLERFFEAGAWGNPGVFLMLQKTRL